METSDPLISVIIPTYNHAQFIPRAIESILAQDYQNYEIIVVDDGSTDDTQQVLLAYSTQVHLVRQPNSGLSAARNSGIERAKGEFLQFLDADDFFPGNRFSAIMAFYRENPQYGAVYTGWEYMDTSGEKRLGTGRPNISGDVLKQFLRRSLSFPPGAILIRSECIQKAGLFDTELRAAEDINLWLRVAGAGFQFGYLDDILFSYRVVSGSLSRRLGHQYHFEALQLDRFFSDPNLPADILAMRPEAHAILHCEYFTRFLNSGEIDTAKQHLATAIGLWPGLLEQPAWVQEWITAYALGPEVHNPAELIDLLFDNLPDEASSLRRLRKRVHGHCHTVQIYKDFQESNLGSIRAHIVPAFISNPKLLLNRGFVKISLQSLLRSGAH